MGAGAALAQGSPASPGVRAHRALHCKGIFTCAFFVPSRALFLPPPCGMGTGGGLALSCAMACREQPPLAKLSHGAAFHLQCLIAG